MMMRIRIPPDSSYSPYKFEAPWSAWEFSYHVLHKQANLVILSMAWLTREDARSYSRAPKDPDMETLSYWLARLEPIIRDEGDGEIIVVLANRTGTEEEAVYAGTSAVLGIQSGEVKVYGILGRGEKELLVVDTNKRPQAKLVSMPVSSISNQSEASTINSIDSQNSEASALTVDTACTSPTLDEVPRTMADVMMPVSPADPYSPNAYFSKGKMPEPDSLRENLISSIDNPQSVSPDLSSPDINHSKFPVPELIQEALKSSIEAPTFTPPVPSSPTFNRPQSPKSRNASRTRPPNQQEPALISHDLAQEEQITERAVSVRTPPQIGMPQHIVSTPPDNFQSCFASTTFGSRSQYISPRPKSTVW